MNCPHCFTKLNPSLVRLASGGVRCLHCKKFIPISEDTPECKEVTRFVEEYQGVIKRRLMLEAKAKKAKKGVP